MNFELAGELERVIFDRWPELSETQYFLIVQELLVDHEALGALMGFRRELYINHMLAKRISWFIANTNLLLEVMMTSQMNIYLPLIH